jgi:hypothetical protein
MPYQMIPAEIAPIKRNDSTAVQENICKNLLNRHDYAHVLPTRDVFVCRDLAQCQMGFMDRSAVWEVSALNGLPICPAFLFCD